MSICLYNSLCHNIVGSAEYVRLIRLINAFKDRITSNTLHKTCITSGSFGEGLELKGSDLDIMVTDPGKEVIEQMIKHQDYHSDKTYYLVETNDIKPGFAYLRLLNENTKIAYLHLLTFLCHKQMNNTRNYQESLGDLRLTIEEDYFMSDFYLKAAAFDCLGVAFQIIGDTEAAREAFVKSTEIFPDQLINRSFQRLAIPK
ncbi:unnamed protein product [Mytilus edulis]|uniref:Uncharacterized protein n=1 Tax=Mytilus edulis TaxID=6550 RepID=A0A8S3PPP3_MYTED|nr:unnamed protein product [Mytilus edulis]